MSVKKLDQGVFEGLPKEYRWAAVDANGEAHLYNRTPELSVGNDVFGYFTNFRKGDDYLDLGDGYDATDWQNSLIERQDVPTAADIDWSRQEVPAGATHYEAGDKGFLFYRKSFGKWAYEGNGKRGDGKTHWVLLSGEPAHKKEIPTANRVINWDKAPEGKTHYCNKTDEFYSLQGHSVMVWNNGAWERIAEFTTTDLDNIGAVKPEPQVDWSKAPEGATHWHRGDWIRWTGKRNHVFGSWDMDGWLGGDWALAHWGWQGTLETFLADGAIPRPESITELSATNFADVRFDVDGMTAQSNFDATMLNFGNLRYPFNQTKEQIQEVARSIEAARVAEKSMPYPDGDARYFETSDVPETKKYPHYFKDVSAVDAIDLYHVARLYEITDPALFHAFKKIACAGKRGAKDQAQDVQEAIDALKRWQELNV